MTKLPDSMAWSRVELPGAGISIEQNPDWPALREAELYYQRSSDEGLVVVRWDRNATIDELLARTGKGSLGSTAHTDEDVATTVDDLAARRVKITVIGAEAVSHSPTPRKLEREHIYVWIGFQVGTTPVAVGYQAPGSQFGALAPLGEHIIASIKRLSP